MSFYEISFPVNPSYGSGGGPGFNNAVIDVDSGQDSVVSRRSTSRRIYDASFQIRTLADVTAVLAFYQRVGGVANGFRYKDLADYTSTALGRLWGDDSPPAIAATDQVLGVGNGVKTQFQLVKTYGTTTPQHVRNITKPIVGTVVVALDGVPQASGWSIDTTTGTITFTVAPAAGVVVSAGFEYEVPVRFSVEVDEVLEGVIDSFGTAEIPRIPMREILGSITHNENRLWGGATFVTVNADFDLSLLKAQLWTLDPQAGTYTARLPAKATMPLGPDLFTLHNANGSNAIAIDDSDTTTTVHTLAAGTTQHVSLRVDGSGNRVWEVHF